MSSDAALRIQVTKVFEVVAARPCRPGRHALFAVGLFKAKGSHVLCRLFVCLMAIAGECAVYYDVAVKRRD